MNNSDIDMPVDPLEVVQPTFAAELSALINRRCRENYSNTPDFILGMYLENCLLAFETATQQRETWYGRDGRPTIDGDGFVTLVK